MALSSIGHTGEDRNGNGGGVGDDTEAGTPSPGSMVVHRNNLAANGEHAVDAADFVAGANIIYKGWILTCNLNFLLFLI